MKHRISGLLIMPLLCLQLMSIVGVASAGSGNTLPSYSATSFGLIPKVDEKVITDTYHELTKSDTSHQFWEKYNEKANSREFDPSKTSGLANQLATGVMTWDTIIAYASVIIEFISNLGLVVGAGFIIYSGYEYAMSAFGVKEEGSKKIKNAIIGITVITTSYGIFRLLTKIFIE